MDFKCSNHYFLTLRIQLTAWWSAIERDVSPCITVSLLFVMKSMSVFDFGVYRVGSFISGKEIIAYLISEAWNINTVLGCVTVLHSVCKGLTLAE